MPAAASAGLKGRDRHARTFYHCHRPTTNTSPSKRRLFPIAASLTSNHPDHEIRQIHRPCTAASIRRINDYLTPGDNRPSGPSHLDLDLYNPSPWVSEDMAWITQEIRVPGWRFQILEEHFVWVYVSAPERDVCGYDDTDWFSALGDRRCSMARCERFQKLTVR